MRLRRMRLRIYRCGYQLLQADWLDSSTEHYSSCCRPSPIASTDTSCLFSPWVVIGLLTLLLFTFINSPLLNDPQLLHFSMSFVFYRTLADNTTQLDYNVS